MDREVITTNKTEIQEIVGNTVRSALESLKSDLIKSGVQTTNQKLTRLQVVENYHLSLPTILKYEKLGILKGVRIGRRVLYDRDTIEKNLTPRNFE